ncbi:hypothetical protein HNP81_002854 [Peribacillus huizhouensis]|uniref:Cardiolipin synthase N-terminal domain-containing protein n=1 Tax=Peribacillus huizhouensis TaxID=1501239 RepID=A0ABR6CRI6_9BACI|nr:hypothetical protein [Peribacillus huizhouensis]
MTILAWYSVAFLAFLVISSVADEKRKEGDRLLAVFLLMPVLIFATLYVII